MNSIYFRFFAATFCSFFFGNFSHSHHSASAFYDLENMISVEGKIVSVDWKNPHVFLNVEVYDSDGNSSLWNMESGSINTLQRFGISKDEIEIGEKINIIGAVSRHGLNEMLAVTISSLSTGVVTVHPNIARNFLTNNNLVALPISSEAEKEARDNSSGFFKVWTPLTRPNTNTGIHNWPLTTKATSFKSSWNPLTDELALDCISPGVIPAMDSPYPIELKEEGENIIMYLEEWDGKRVFHLNHTEVSIDQNFSHMGASSASWEGENKFIVETRNINYPFFDDRGTPLSPDAIVKEEFSLSEDGETLSWLATTYDPENFTEPVTLEATWTWVAGEAIKPYNCTL